MSQGGKWTLRTQRPAGRRFNYTEGMFRWGIFLVAAASFSADSRIVLREGWTLSPNGGASHRIPVPSTVFSELVEAKVYPDPYFGTNLRGVPDAPFRRSWWYRTEFKMPA